MRRARHSGKTWGDFRLASVRSTEPLSRVADPTTPAEVVVRELGKALQSQPEPGLYYDRAIAWCQLGSWNKALEDLDGALELNPDMGCAYSLRGRVLAILGDYSRAFFDLCRAVRLELRPVDALIARARVYTREGRAQAAHADLDRALRLEPGAQAGELFQCAAEELAGLESP